MVETIHPVETETWRVRLLRDEDRAKLLRLAASNYADKEPGNPEYIDWLCSDAPAGRPTVIIGEDIKSHDVVGYIWNLPYWMKVGTEIYRCNMCCNGLVHPDFRRGSSRTPLHIPFLPPASALPIVPPSLPARCAFPR